MNISVKIGQRTFTCVDCLDILTILLFLSSLLVAVAVVDAAFFASVADIRGVESIFLTDASINMAGGLQAVVVQ